MPFLTPTDRQRRIIQLSQEWGVDLPRAQTPLTRPHNPPSFWTSKDDQIVEELMQRRAAEVAQYRQRSSLSKAFSSNNLKKGKNWDPNEILEVLTSWVANSGSPGVAEALISKLAAGGVEFSGNQTNHKSGILSRRKSVNTFVDRSKFLKLAVEGNQYNMLQVLLPHADSYSIDQALAPAIRNGNVPIAELILRYGACASQTPEGQDAFRRACVDQNRSGLIGLILRSENRPSTAWISACMTDAAKAACLEAVLYLSRSTADGNYNGAEALKASIALGRQDIALAIIMGNTPPQGPGLDESFQVLYEHPSISPSTKLAMAELLLCAGARGDVVSRALESACETQFYDMANLLSRYGASIEYNDATVLKTAIARGELDLVSSLLADSARLSPALASSCVPLIAKQAPFETRVMVLDLLMRKGANGVALDDMLIDAAEAGDIDSIDLLLNPVFPDSAPTTTGRTKYPQSPNGSLRHEVASVNHKSGEALRTAVLRGDAFMTNRILSGKPTAETLSVVFPLTKQLSPKDRYQMVQLFLKRSLSGPCLHAALHDAINEDASQRDNALIKLLLEHNADINFGSGSGLAGVIKQKDIKLLQSLLRNASPQTAAARIMDAMEVSDHRERFEMTSMLIDAGAVIGTQEIAKALLQTLKETPVDMSLLRLLLQQGGADINLLEGAIVKKAVSNSDPKVLDMVFGLGKPSASTVTCAFNEMAPLPSTDSKAWKLRAILSKCTHKNDLHWVLVHEVQSVLKTDNAKASLTTLKILLDGGADPNTYKAAALCHAVIGANSKVTDMLFEAKTPPTSASLGAALPHVLRIADPMERLTLTKKLVDAGAHPLEVNRALVHAISAYPEDVSLQSALAAAADTSDGEALSLSVSKESPETMDLLLAKSQSTVATRSSMLSRAMDIKNRAARQRMCESLLKLGVSVDIASGALLVAARDGDVKLGDLLMAHGASIATNNGQAIIEACRGGSAEILSILLKQDGNVSKSTLEAGFQAATEVRDLSKRALVFEQLLKKGIKGDLVDAQLQSAARYGEDGQAVLRVLLVSGADPNFNSGECVVAATRSAFIGNLELLLGLWSEGGNQKKVAQPALARSLKACWNLGRDSRFKVISDLIKAGLQITEELHIALNEAVNEDDPEERLVRLLLNHGASPAANGCKTLIDAANNSASKSLALLLEKNLPEEDVNRAFNNAFTAATFDKWFTNSGLETASILLDKGANGDSLSGALVLAMKRSTTDTKDLTDRFVTLLVSHGADVNYNNGEPLQQAASKANVSWTKQLLERRPTIGTLSLAFQCIFDTALSQDEVLDLFKLFAEYRDGDVRIDVMSGQQGTDPVLVRAISQYPRSTTILETLLDAGLYYDQATTYKIHPDVEDAEDMTLLLWSISQPQKRVSNSVIELLIARGAKVNAETNLSCTTPLMLAIQTRRPDLVKLLLLEGAEVDVLDYLGRTPLSMATNIGGDISIQIMSLLLAADPSRDDGSLHNAARDLNLSAVKVLVQSGHDPDFPSPLHEGRSALAELCLHGSDNAEVTPDRERAMQKVMTFLIDAKSDLSIKLNDKTLLHVCFEAADPVSTTRCFLKSGMWKHINKPFNQYTADGYIYSPTMYVKKLLPQNDRSASLLKVLKSNRANDVYYALSGTQPADALGLPEDLAVQERARKARAERLAEETEEFSIAMARKREIASVEHQILAQKAEMEDRRRQKLHNEDISAVRSRAQLEESLATTAHTRRLQEHHALAESSIARARALAAAELESEGARQRRALEWETKLNTEKVDNAQALSSIRISERQEVERLDQSAEARIKDRLNAQRKLVESQEKLAKRLADGPNGVAGMSDARRQIGYVTEMN
ncbi:hypothetical protein QQS21_007518 [Conoideocrella luteorostrata]|uniref:Ankyrin repeat-containing domain protein n=1 Tax=Conoideocrella luteorostrata TaxID=1105319 RepID=A0AAJ0CPX6_9HYPO|nr:hypothetical protein QQS21_007518 [Conoideocrella luteorostrata]